MGRELYCNWFDDYVKILPEHETDKCNDYPVGCNPQDCEYCKENLFDDEGNRVD